MSGLELSLALLRQRPREPQELFDLLVQVAIVLVIILIPAAKAVFQAIQKGRPGQGPPASPGRPSVPEGQRGGDGGGRPTGLELFEELLRGGPAASQAEERGAEPAAGHPQAPFGTLDPDTVQETRHPTPAEVAAERREEGQRARQRERAVRRAEEAQRAEERARRHAERGSAQRERQSAARRARERERDSGESLAESRVDSPAGLELESLAIAVPRARRPIFARERTRAGWRDAVVLAEVLGAPLALRDPRRGPGSPAPRGD